MKVRLESLILSRYFLTYEVIQTGKTAATSLLLLGIIIIYSDPEQPELRSVGTDHSPH